MNIQKRNTSLDITRIIAFLSVIGIHFFMNIDYYTAPMLGGRMLVLTVMRMPFTVCVPLFIMLTGYLMNKKTLSCKYYLGIIKTLGIYVLASVACLVYKRVAFGIEMSARGTLFGILDFSAANYSWYIEMYIGLFLLIPFINLMYVGLKTRKQKLILIGTMIALTSLPSVVNIYNFTVEGWWKTPYLSIEYSKLIPSFFTDLYPITYYFLGAYFREFPCKIKKLPNLLLFFGASVLFGLFNYYRSWGGYFSWREYTDWNSLLTLVLSATAFVFLVNRDTTRCPSPIKKVLAYISDLCLGAYLASYISDCIVYGYLKTAVPEVLDRIPYIFIAVPASAFIALVISAVLNLVYTGVERLVHLLIFALKRRFKRPAEPLALPSQPTLIETERLILRPWRESDTDDLYEYAKDPDVGIHAGWKPHESLDESRSIVELFMSGSAGIVWAIENKSDGKVIGSVGLHKRSRLKLAHDLELGYVLSKQYWGAGIMTEATSAVVRHAFTSLGAETLAVSHFDGNERSRRVIEKLGFRYVRKYEKSYKRFDGEFLAEHVYIMSASELVKQDKQNSPQNTTRH